ncbi:uncharacterized protein LOC126665062 isoform X2 [Mercurialis annua]|uniref:uncharacterized protein LOC126665062 isoform X2 n=1 Tax=Mercurialis annua TaxID=3986 RepID=UPI00215FB062|nr:uncharacterized protein LOC126665062 isoform X2 [Mercurialis annua]
MLRYSLVDGVVRCFRKKAALQNDELSSDEEEDYEEVEDFELQEKMKEEKYEKYFKQVSASGGFDVDSLCSDSSLVDEIRPLLRVGGEPDEDLKVMTDFAIEQQNKQEGTNLQLVKIVKANFGLVSGGMYYITIEAKDGEENINTYQAQVYDGFKHRELELFRVQSSNSESSDNVYD